MSKPLALIVEDTEDLAEIFAEALEAAGYETDLAPDGKIALEKLAASVPALVVLDMHLPHVAGYDILTQIRADARLESTRVIIATADVARAHGDANEQADVVLAKPISFSQLRELAMRMYPTGNAPAE